MTATITITVDSRQQELILDTAASDADGPGWCFCSDSDDDICPTCASREARAREYGETAKTIRTTRHGQEALALPADAWELIVRALGETADDGDCQADQADQAEENRALAAIITHTLNAA